MAEAKSLLSLIGRGYAAGREDAATEALRFILSRSDSARAALSGILGYSGDSLPIASFSTQLTTAGARPDMVCLDDHEHVLAFVESKFWASLTRRQPVDYWEALPDDRTATLLFLAPAARIAHIDNDSLWGELVKRMHDAGHTLGPVNQGKGLVKAKSTDGKHRLMLTSWEVLLDRLGEAAKKDEDVQASFEVAELRGLAYDAIKDTRPVDPYTNLKQLITEAVAHLRDSGWAYTEGLRGRDDGTSYVRFILLGGVAAGVRIDYKAVKQMDRSLWLWFWSSKDSRSSMSLDEVRERLDPLAESGLQWLGQDVCVPIDLRTDADRDATLCTIVSKLERIAKILDPNGPTYRDGMSTG
ncbi:MAG: hypothetical protein OXI70_02560 [Chloroflexota bacterium]|nr:hypothetical protein [Chloroflexota bacterium]